jgi:Flp pilus assembly protein TadD
MRADRDRSYLMNQCPKRLFLNTFIALFALRLTAQAGTDSPQKVNDLELQAREYLREQKPNLAIPLFRQIITLNPQNVDAQANLGVLLFFQGDYSEAITRIRAALQLAPKLWKVQALLGIAEKRTGDFVAARRDLEQSLPNLEDAKIRKEAGLELVEIVSASGELDRAATIIAMLEEAAPADPQILLAAYQISSQTTERTLLNTALAAPNSAELHMMMADQFVLLGDSANAIAQYREAIRQNAQLPGVHFELAVQLEQSSNPGARVEAEHEFRTALSLNRFDEKAWRALGEIMVDKGDYDAAKEDYTKALALMPKDSDVEADLAKLFVIRGDFDAATPLLENAVRDDPTNAMAHYQLSGVYRRAGRTADAQQEMKEFSRYKTLKDSLGKMFRQFRQQDLPSKIDP